MLPLNLMTTVIVDGLDKLDKVEPLGGASGQASWIPGELIGLVAVILIFGTPVIIVLAVLRHRANRQRLINEMVLKLADKGQPVPPEVFMEPVRRRSDLRTALSLIGVGFGLMGFFHFVGAREGIGIGLIPLAIGIGQLIAWQLERRGKAD